MAGPHPLSRSLLALAFGVLVARAAAAGDGVHVQIVGSTPDARGLAVVANGEATWVCGLVQAPPTLPLARAALTVTAQCGGSGPVLPLERWTWNRHTPEVNELKPLTPVATTANPPARLTLDPDTQVRSIEVSHQGVWYPVLVDEDSTLEETTGEERYASPGTRTPGRFSELQGFLRTEGRIVVTFSNTNAYGLLVLDKAIALSDAAVVDVGGRFTQAVEKARSSSHALREQYAARGGVFTPLQKSQKLSKRKIAAAARDALKLWEQARVFGSLDSAALADALWLLAWLEAPTRRQEAMRLYLELNDRDKPAAQALVTQLAAAPQTLPLSAHLQTGTDPLRGLPAVNACSFKRLSAAELTGLSDTQLLWLHRALWAARGGYRFSDPQVQAYFEGFVWYAPLPKAIWRKYATPKFRENPDAPLLKKRPASVPAGFCGESLELLVSAEQARGLAAPSL